MIRRLLLPCLNALCATHPLHTALAQEGRRGPPAGEGGMQRGGPGGPRGEMGTERTEDSLAIQLRTLHDALQLDARQEALWLNYADKIQAFISDMQRPNQAGTKPDAPHRIEARIAPLRNRLAALEQISDAAERLYRNLDARQRELADELLADTVPLLPDRIDLPGGPATGSREAGPPGMGRRRG
ncbi:hypothetical protein OPU71_06310 [Niveibacterium sp. 24ML]|uniref:hypothetical protein n=1 Tax=Niveibacterium sp. 24ML TaxID=2985512 RepID=UPI00226E2ABB|nr:hypothetical protein [Niveibacterium sp. 24ML]MCX9155737.1 hypothetical protein [Niveibacterium sp. 24ML]